MKNKICTINLLQTMGLTAKKIVYCINNKTTFTENKQNHIKEKITNATLKFNLLKYPKITKTM
jgi:hypothetical protein